MSIFDVFRKKVLSDGNGSELTEKDNTQTDNLIALGVLLWAIAEADEKFLPHEMDEIKKILNDYSEISQKDMPIVLRAIKEASLDRIDLNQFTTEASVGMDRDQKIAIIDNLFRVACIDKDIDPQEEAMIRQSSGLLGLDHKEFINAKIKAKKECGLLEGE